MLGPSGSVENRRCTPRDLENVNEWKIIFDPCILLHCRNQSVGLSSFFENIGGIAAPFIVYGVSILPVICMPNFPGCLSERLQKFLTHIELFVSIIFEKTNNLDSDQV